VFVPPNLYDVIARGGIRAEAVGNLKMKNEKKNTKNG